MEYIHGWRRIETTDDALVFGSMIHDLIENRPNPLDDIGILEVLSKVKGAPSDRAALEAKAAAVYKVYHKIHNLYKENRVGAEHHFAYTYRFTHNGRKYEVPLMGYIDCVLKEPKGQIAVRETKTRTDLAVDNTSAVLCADLQVNSYFLACEQYLEKFPTKLIYDLVKRPQHKFNPEKESLSQFHERILQMVSSSPETYLHRIKYEVSPEGFNLWRQQILHHHLAEFVEWYKRLEANKWRALEPYNPVSLVGKYGPCDLFNLIVNGSTLGLMRKERNRQ